MDEEERAFACPFLKRAMSDFMWMQPTALYCRPPSGRIRIPSRDTLARVCTNGDYPDCPNYQRWSLPPQAILPQNVRRDDKA